MGSINTVFVLGRLGQDPEVRSTNSGGAVCNFSVATDESYTKSDGEKVKKTEWHKVVVFGNSAESAGKYLKKGSECVVQGKLQTRSYEKDGVKHYSTEIVADRVTFVGGKPVAASTKAKQAGFDDEDPPF